MATVRDEPGAVPADRLAAAWPDETQRERCLAALVADGLLVVAGPSAYALPH